MSSVPDLLKKAYYSWSSSESYSPNHVQGDSLSNPVLGPDPVDRLLHFSKPPILPLYCIGCRGKKLLIKECQGFFQVRRKDLLQRRENILEPQNPRAKSCQLFYPGFKLTSPVKKGIDSVHDFPKSPQHRVSTRDSIEALFLLRAQFPLDQQISVIKEVSDLLFQAGLFPAGLDFPFARGFSSLHLGDCLFDFLSNLCQSPKNGRVYLLDDMKFTKLMGNTRKMDAQGFRIQRGAIGSNALQHKVSLKQYLAKSRQEPMYIGVVGRVVQNLDQQTMELLVIDHHQDAERPIVNFVDCDVTRKLLQDIVEIGPANVIDTFFFPRLRPSFARFLGGPRPDGLATNSNWLLRREDCPQRRDARQGRQLARSTGNRVGQGLKGRGRKKDRMERSSVGKR